MITGAGRGIGVAIASEFEAAGYTVIRCDRRAQSFNCDLARDFAAPTLINEAIHKYGKIDVLVNNARAFERVKIDKETEDDWDREMAVNLKSAYFLGKYAIENMTGGAVINVGSVTTHFVSHESGSYQISKGAVLSLTRVLAALGGPRGVRCNAVLPGFIVKPESAERYAAGDNEAYRQKIESLHPIGRAGTGEDVAQAVRFLAEAPWITGASLVVDGGLTIQEVADFTLHKQEKTS